MKPTKDLNWLSAPAFILILGMIVFNAIKQTSPVKQPKSNTISTVTVVQKPV